MRLRHTSLLIPPTILLSLLPTAGFAQQPGSAPSPRDHDTNAMDSSTTDATTPAPPLTPEQIALLDRYLTDVHAQLVGRIDTRSAAAGQGITLQVTRDATLANGAQLPKGTKLTGHILRAQPFEKDGAAAVLSINIDRALLRDGKTIPIRCVVRTLASGGGPKPSMPDSSRGAGGSSIGGGLSPINDPGANFPIGAQTGGGMGGADSSGIGGMGGGTDSPMGGSGYPGATTGTRSGSTSGSSTRNPIGTGDPGLGGSTRTIGDRTRDALGQTTSVPAAANPAQPVASAGVDLHDAPQRTGLPGVMLSGRSVAGVSGTLSAFERNVVLDSNTQLTLGVISQ